MALQDLTPQLRTRLNRMERAVGWFVFFATALLILGFGYYLYHAAKTRGWLLTKVAYETGVNNAAGLNVGNPVKLMGFNAGEITGIVPNNPSAYYGVTVYFNIKDPNYGYIWSDSKVKISADLLGNRYLEVTKGQNGLPTVIENNHVITGILKHQYVNDRHKELMKEGKTSVEAWRELNQEKATNLDAFYESPESKPICWVNPDETPALNDRLQKLADEIESALPHFLSLTNQIAVVLSNSINLTSNLDAVAVSVRPGVSNFNLLTAQIAQMNQPGALGEWLLPTNINQKLDSFLGNTDTNLAAVAEGLTKSLNNLANITSNLNNQVQVNTNILSQISKAIVDADDFVQGMKNFWLFRSAFRKENTNKIERVIPLQSPRGAANH